MLLTEPSENIDCLLTDMLNQVGANVDTLTQFAATAVHQALGDHILTHVLDVTTLNTHPLLQLAVDPRFILPTRIIGDAIRHWQLEMGEIVAFGSSGDTQGEADDLAFAEDICHGSFASEASVEIGRGQAFSPDMEGDCFVRPPVEVDESHQQEKDIGPYEEEIQDLGTEPLPIDEMEFDLGLETHDFDLPDEGVRDEGNLIPESMLGTRLEDEEPPSSPPRSARGSNHRPNHYRKATRKNKAQSQLHDRPRRRRGGGKTKRAKLVRRSRSRSRSRSKRAHGGKQDYNESLAVFEAASLLSAADDEYAVFPLATIKTRRLCAGENTKMTKWIQGIVSLFHLCLLRCYASTKIPTDGRVRCCASSVLSAFSPRSVCSSVVGT